MKVWVVQGEHPFHPYFPLEVWSDEALAHERAVSLTKEFLDDYWAIKHDGDDEAPAPHVTIENWEDIVEEHGCDEGFVQDDNWGRWSVWVQEEEIRNGK